MAPSEIIMIQRRSKRSAKVPVKRDRIPCGTSAAMVARERTAGEPVRSVRYQMRAYCEIMLLRMDRACPVQRRANFCFQCGIIAFHSFPSRGKGELYYHGIWGKSSRRNAPVRPMPDGGAAVGSLTR